MVVPAHRARRRVAPLLSVLTAIGAVTALGAGALASGQVRLASAHPDTVGLAVVPGAPDTVAVRWPVEESDLTLLGTDRGGLVEYLQDTITVGDASGASCHLTPSPPSTGDEVELRYRCAGGTDVVDVGLTAFLDLDPGRRVEVAGPHEHRVGYTLEEPEHTWRLATGS